MDNDDIAVLMVLWNVQTTEHQRLKPLLERHGLPAGTGPAELLHELRQDGSNTLLLPFRPEGVHYGEIVRDVARSIGATVGADLQATEDAVVATIIEKYIESCSPEERAAFDQAIDGLGGDAAKSAGRRAGGKAVSAMVLAAVARFGAKTVLKEILKRLPSLAVPGLGWLMAAWTVLDVAGPAMRKTIPTVFEIALLRMEFGGDGPASSSS